MYWRAAKQNAVDYLLAVCHVEATGSSRSHGRSAQPKIAKGTQLRIAARPPTAATLCRSKTTSQRYELFYLSVALPARSTRWSAGQRTSRGLAPRRRTARDFCTLHRSCPVAEQVAEDGAGE